MDIRRIRQFLTLAETLNFSEAARKCGVSQPALSKAVQKLESELGGPLVRREGRLTHLTHLGRAMAKQLTEVERASAIAESTARKLSTGQVQPLEIAVMCTVGPYRLSPFLLAFQAEHPDVEITLHDSPAQKINADLLSGMVDLAIIGAPMEDSDRLRHVPLYSERMVMACANDHPYANRDKVTLHDIARQPYLDRLHCEFRDIFMSQALREHAPMRVALRSEREDWIQYLVRTGQGVTILPEHSVVMEGIATVPLERADTHRDVLLAVATGREDQPAVRAFIAMAKRRDWLIERS